MLENKIAELLGQLSDKLGVASSKIWEWSLLQVKVEIAQAILVTIAFLLVGVVFAFCAIQLARVEKEKVKLSDFQEAVIFTLALLSGIGGIILGVVSVCELAQLPKLLINPEYAAFQNIVEQLGSLK